ncbi:MAG: hypothetical protein ABJB16_08960 [Saprospiraceae bacterium]
MKNLTFLMLTLLFMAACQQSSDELVSLDTSSQITQRSQQTRVFKANISGTLDASSAPTACTGDLPGLALTGYSLSGNANHLGILNKDLSVLHHDACDLSFATMLLTTSVSGQLAAANGDLVYYTGNDVINVFNLLTGSGTTGTITGTWTITGGTGRFDGASGSFTINGLVDFTTLNLSVEANGTITY